MFASFGVFGTGLVLGMPIAFVLALTGFVYMMQAGEQVASFTSYLFGALNSSALLAIPFFILSAEILNRSGGTKRLVEMVDACLGHNRGGLPVVAVVAVIFFSSISGSSSATAAAIGSAMIPQMIERGYGRNFSVGLIASAGGLGILIPPSVPLIIYGMVTDTSVGALFKAGLVPGLILGGLFALVAYWGGRRSGVKPAPPQPWDVRLRATRRASGVLLMPVLILGGMYSGIFTPTEASAVACVYALVLAVIYRTPLADIPRILTSSSMTSGVILLILASANLLSYALTAERIPHSAFQYIAKLQLEYWQIIGILMIFYILCGMFLEVISIILITMPILLPLLTALEVNLVHFAIILIINMEVAVISPPIGLNLFIVSSVSKVPVVEVFKGTLIFLPPIVLMMLCLMYMPGAEILTSGW